MIVLSTAFSIGAAAQDSIIFPKGAIGKNTDNCIGELSG